MSSTTHACCLSCLGKQPVLLQLCQNDCASATNLQSADKTGDVTSVVMQIRMQFNFPQPYLKKHQFIFIL
jgi:hypothetical protein